MRENLSKSQLVNVIDKIFAPKSQDKRLAILVDVPTPSVPDTADWQDRRTLALEWYSMLRDVKAQMGFEQIDMVYFDAVGSNNAELPATGLLARDDGTPPSTRELQSPAESLNLWKQLATTDVVLAPTQFSASAPLKLLAKKYGFRAASMPGFSRDMIPALEIDYDLVHEHVLKLKTRLDQAIGIVLLFEAENQPLRLFADLRHRIAHASSGLCRERGETWNLPSGEAFIVPYEGEGEAVSQTEGYLPVQFGNEIVVYRIQQNRAFEIISNGPVSDIEKARLRDEPAYGNIAEIGFGVLRPFGVGPVGATLLDEKLGLHIAFGRSDHFGGAIGPKDFRNSESVVHIDRIYIPEVQDKVQVRKLEFVYSDRRAEVIIENSEYVI